MRSGGARIYQGLGFERGNQFCLEVITCCWFGVSPHLLVVVLSLDDTS